MHILESSQYLVKEKLHVVVRQFLLTLNNGSEVRLHEFVNKVNIVELLLAFWLKQSFQTDYILMLEQSQ
jgi:hypothetical protein